MCHEATKALPHRFMDIARPLRTLWRHRRILVLGGVLAVVAAVMVMYRLPSLQSRDNRLGIASEEILVDTTTSQIASVNADNSGIAGNALGGTATLLATVMTQGSIVREITQSTGLDPARFDAVSLSLSQLSGGGSGSAQAPVAPPSDSVVSGPGSAVMTTQALTDANGNSLPIISIQALAWTPDVAARVVNTAVSSIDRYVTSTVAAEKIPDSQQLRLEPLGPAQASYEPSGPSPVEAGGVAIVIFVLVCLGILVASATARGWRRAAALEDQDFDALDFDLKDQGSEPWLRTRLAGSTPRFATSGLAATASGGTGTAEHAGPAVRRHMARRDEDAAFPDGITRGEAPENGGVSARGPLAASSDPTPGRDADRAPSVLTNRQWIR